MTAIYLIAGGVLCAIALAACLPSLVVASRPYPPMPTDTGGDLDAWLAMSPTPEFDRLSIEFFDAALGDDTGGAA